MTPSSVQDRRPIAALVCACTLALSASCSGPSKPPPTTKPAHLVAEKDLVAITLSPEAEQRLGIATAPVTLERVARRRTFSGELLLPLAHGDGHDRSVFSLLPTMTPTELARAAELQIDADGQVAAARVQLDAARVVLARSEQLVDSKAGPRRVIDDARTQVQLAEAALETARAKRALLGAPVFEAVRTAGLWVRVSLYAGDLQRIDRTADAAIAPLGADDDAAARSAHPLTVPFAGGTGPTNTEVFYALDQPDERLHSGQRVSVAIPLTGDVEQRVVPSGAILYDVHGGAWVYVQAAPHVFHRARVDVQWIGSAGAVLARGPAAGARVVTDGAAELFGTEFGSGK